MTTTVDDEKLRNDANAARLDSIEANAPPILKASAAAPAITGTAKVGQTLTVSAPVFSQASGITVTYQWKKAGTNISGATSSTYTPVTGDIGSTLTAAWTASNSKGTAFGETAATAAIASGQDSATTALLAAMTVQPTSTRADAIDAFITGIKADGIWSKLDALWVFAAHDVQAAKLNWKNPSANVATFNGTYTWTTDHGFAGDGSTGYVNTNWNPTVHGVNFTQNSAGFTFYQRANLSGSNSVVGWYDGADGITANVRVSVVPVFRINQAASTTCTTAIGSGQAVGLFYAERTASNATAFYRDGSSTPLGTGTNASTALNNANLNVGHSTSSSYASNEIPLFAVHGPLTSTEWAAWASRIATLQTAIGW